MSSAEKFWDLGGTLETATWEEASALLETLAKLGGSASFDPLGPSSFLVSFADLSTQTPRAALKTLLSAPFEIQTLSVMEVLNVE